MKVSEFVGERMMLARRRTRLTQVEVAKEMNVTSATISRWEGGLHGPNWLDLYDLATLYEVAVSFFFEGLEDVQITRDTREPNFWDASARVLAMAA